MTVLIKLMAIMVKKAKKIVSVWEKTIFVSLLRHLLTRSRKAEIKIIFSKIIFGYRKNPSPISGLKKRTPAKLMMIKRIKIE